MIPIIETEVNKSVSIKTERLIHVLNMMYPDLKINWDAHLQLTHNDDIDCAVTGICLHWKENDGIDRQSKPYSLPDLAPHAERTLR